MTIHRLVLVDRSARDSVQHRHRWAPECSCGRWVGRYRRRRREAVEQHRVHAAVEDRAARHLATNQPARVRAPGDNTDGRPSRIAPLMCGYCGGPLTQTAAGDYRCEPCQPGLAAIGANGESQPERERQWAEFIRARGRLVAARAITAQDATDQQGELF